MSKAKRKAKLCKSGEAASGTLRGQTFFFRCGSLAQASPCDSDMSPDGLVIRQTFSAQESLPSVNNSVVDSAVESIRSDSVSATRTQKRLFPFLFEVS